MVMYGVALVLTAKSMTRSLENVPANASIERVDADVNPTKGRFPSA
jgi:hypothetical protein